MDKENKDEGKMTDSQTPPSESSVSRSAFRAPPSETPVPRSRVLVVDDEESLRFTLGEFLKGAGYEVCVADDADQALASLAAAEFDVVVTDIILPRVTGVSLLKTIKETAPHVQVILMTGEPTVETASEAVRAGAFDYLAKPIRKEALLKTVANAAKLKVLDDERRRLEEENHRYQDSLEHLVEERTQELQKSTERYRQLIEHSPYGIYQIDRQGRFLSGNKAGLEILGRAHASDIVGLRYLDTVSDENRARIDQLMQLAFDGDSQEFECQGVREKWYQSVLVPLRDEAGNTMNLMSISLDITERKRSEMIIRTRAFQQEGVAKLGLHALSEKDLSSLMKEAVISVAHMLNVPYCKVLELLPSGEGLVLRAGVGWKDGLVGQAIVGGDLSSQAGFTLNSKEPVIVENLRTDTRFSGPTLLHDHGVVSGMSVIIQGKDQPFGVLGVHTTEQQSFSGDDIQFLQTVANVLAQAITRKKIEDALEYSYDVLEQRVRERTSELAQVNTRLTGEIQVRTRAETNLADALGQIQKSRDDLLSILNRLHIGTALTDHEGRIVFLSDSAQALFGASTTTIVGKPWEEAFPLTSQDKAKIRTMFEISSEQREKVSVEIPGTRGRSHHTFDIDVYEDPRDSERMMFFLYETTQIHNLRRLLDSASRFKNLSGKSDVMQQVFRHIQDLAHVDAMVLLEGETGTGKELVARAIYETSSRKDKPFLVLNCAGLTEGLVASQLFGHKRGAFTGAISDQVGIFEAANGGTVFLDEIGDIPLNVQTSLLRVLEEKTVTRLGETKPRPINVRILAATHRDLKQEVKANRFREDLLYRVRVARVQLPALRHRREDIPLLAGFFLGLSQAATGKTVDRLDQAAMRLLLDYEWPGNVRELKNAIEFAVIRSHETIIHLQDFPPEILEGTSSQPSQDSTIPSEKQRILDALQRAGGNRRKAAQSLNISKATLYRRLLRLGLTPKH